MKYPPSYEHWDDEQRIQYHTRMIHFYSVLMGVSAVLIVLSLILILAALGDLVFGWTA